MLTLYVKSGCPYCAKVLRAGEELGIVFDEKNVSDEGVTEELAARGGQVQTPYLVDDEANQEMYESDTIIDYLHQRFKKD